MNPPRRWRSLNPEGYPGLVDKHEIDLILEEAANDGRDRLLEHEGYKLINLLGAGRAPNAVFFGDPEKIRPKDLEQFQSSGIVLKIQSPLIAHKTEAGGVKFISSGEIRKLYQGLAENRDGKEFLDVYTDYIKTEIRYMFDHAPEKYALWLSRNENLIPRRLRGLSPDALTFTVRESIRGILIAECIQSDTRTFGAELLIGMRWTREFGPVLTAGLGGVDAEMFAEKFRGDAAVITESPLLDDAAGFLDSFKRTIAYQAISGRIRGRERIISDANLLKCFDALISMARIFNDAAGERVIHELEVNPYVISKGDLVALDMFCTFGPSRKRNITRPINKIEKLLKPKTAGVVGVSSKGMNIGRIILRNLAKGTFPNENLAIIKPGDDEIDGVKCYPGFSDLPFKLDMLVLAVDAAQVPELCKEIIQTDSAESVILIPGGMGEKKGSESLAAEVEKLIQDAHSSGDGGPIFVGGNCLGVLSVPGGYDTMFIPSRKLPKPEKSTPVAFVSQSGAFMITRMSNRDIKPVYAISYGNQTDLTVSDYIHYLKDDPEVSVLAVYVEGFKDYDGIKFAEEVRDAIAKGKDVVFYKAGRTPEGQVATSGHTASIAGDYKVSKAVLEQVGALVTSDFLEFEDFTELAVAFHDSPVNGNRVFGTSNAGYEAVGMADHIIGPGYELKMAKFKPETVARIAEILEAGKLSELVDIKDPIDLNPMASDEVHINVLEALMDDDNGDAIVFSAVPMTGMMQTLPPGVSEHDSIDNKGSLPNRLLAIGNLPKPVVAVIDSGKIYDPLVERIHELGIPVFRSADRAMAALGRYLMYRLRKSRG